MEFICDICNNQYKNYQSLWKHKKFIHDKKNSNIMEKNKKFSCPNCYKKFTRNDNLAIHMKTTCKNKDGKQTTALIEETHELTVRTTELKTEVIKLQKEIDLLKKNSKTIKLQKEIDLLKNNPETIKLQKEIDLLKNNQGITNEDTQKSRGIIYMIQPAELIGSNKYKIGHSKSPKLNRCIKAYYASSRFISINECNNPLILEKKIINEFNKLFKLTAGREIFEGNENLMYITYLKLLNAHKNIYDETGNISCVKPEDETENISCVKPENILIV
jgi:hypothetical protein